MLFFLVVPIAGTCNAASLVVSQGNDIDDEFDDHYYYGGAELSGLTSLIDSTFDTVTVVPDLTQLASLMNHDRLWIDLRIAGPNLSQLEIDNVKAFAATGRRVVMMGDRLQSWVTSILSVVGGEWGGIGNGIVEYEAVSYTHLTLPTILLV